MKLKIIFTFLFVLIFCIYTPKQTYASSNFTSDYQVTYSVADSGITRANLKVTLTNTTSEYYASSYKIQIGFDQINNIAVTDDEGSINPQIEKNEDGYILDITFNKKASGIGKKLNFNLSFDTPDVAKRYGKIWEINIPGIANPDDFETFKVEIKVPPSFGKASIIKPDQPAADLIFDKQQLGKSGISISFGSEQIYSFHLKYHIQNDNLYPVQTEIALPPSTNYQTVYLQNIEPKPLNVTLDQDKNWLAAYELKPSQKMDITVDGKVKIILTPFPEDLSPSDTAKYLEEKPYWQSNSDEIKQLARELRTPEAIYKFVIKALKYDFSRVTGDKPRLGAVEVLKKPDSAVCLEYTDLFIALARAAGIPAREVDGFAYTENSKQRPLSLIKDILHAWPEYYNFDKKTWIMVDPTWGSTTGGIDYFSVLDFDHFAFTIKGISSSYPIPAGGYKLITDKYSKDVSVDFSGNTPPETQNMTISSKLPKYAMSAVPVAGKIRVENTNQNILPIQKILISSKSLTPDSQTIYSPSIPPFGSVDLDVAFDPAPFLTNRIMNFTIHVNDQSLSQSMDISPLLIKRWWMIGGGIALGIFCIIIFIFAVRSRRL